MNTILKQKTTKDNVVVTMSEIKNRDILVTAYKNNARIGDWCGRDLDQADYWYRNVKKLIA
jgi:hypothetical protein